MRILIQPTNKIKKKEGVKNETLTGYFKLKKGIFFLLVLNIIIPLSALSSFSIFGYQHNSIGEWKIHKCKTSGI